MKKELLQERLNAKYKKRSNIFNWRGQFTPEFVEYILESFARPKDIIFDPFSGSGTVLLESARKNLSCYGFDINPSAYLMSKFFKFCNYDAKKRIKLIIEFENKIYQLLKGIPEQLPLKTGSKKYRENYQNLIEFETEVLRLLDNDDEKLIIVNLLFIAEKSKEISLKKAINTSFEYIKKVIIDLPFTNEPINAFLCDSGRQLFCRQFAKLPSLTCLISLFSMI